VWNHIVFESPCQPTIFVLPQHENKGLLPLPVPLNTVKRRMNTPAGFLRCRFFITALFALGLLASSALSQGTNGKIELVGSDSIDLGKFSASEQQAARFQVRNAGTGALKILNVRKTCGCASASSDKPELKPGEVARIETIILPHAISGPFSKNVFVENSDPDNRFLRLTVSGNAIPLVEITPSGDVYAGRIPTNKPWSQTFNLTKTDPAIKLGSITTNGNYPMEAHMESTDGGASNHYRVDVTLLPTAESGDFKGTVGMPVLFPSNQPPISITVSGRIGAELNALPGILNIPLSEAPIQRHFTLRLLGQRSRTLEPNSLKCPQQDGVEFKVEQSKDGHSLEVIAIFSPDFTSQLVAEERVTLAFEMPGASSAQVVCRSKK